jgi:pilus assembly protein CpaB
LYVLASGRLLQESKQGEPAPVDVYTLEVTPEQGERLTLAANKGRLQFALRGALDSDIVLTKGVTVPELLDSFVLAEQKKQQEIEAAGKGTGAKKVVRKRYNPAPKKRKVTVEVIKDLSRSKKVFTL